MSSVFSKSLNLVIYQCQLWAGEASETHECHLHENIPSVNSRTGSPAVINPCFSAVQMPHVPFTNGDVIAEHEMPFQFELPDWSAKIKIMLFYGSFTFQSFF